MGNRSFAIVLVAGLALAARGCSSGAEGEGEGDEGPTGDVKAANIDLSVCAPDHGPFSVTIDNPFLPYAVGAVSVLEGKEGGTDPVKVQFTVLDQTQGVVGVTTRVIEEKVWEKGAYAGTQKHYVAQASDGTVCIFGVEGAGTEEEWMAGAAGAVPAILMPANPKVGMVFDTVHAPPVVTAVEVSAIGQTRTVPAGTYTDTVTLLGDEGGPTLKVYARGVGLVYDDGVELISTGK